MQVRGLGGGENFNSGVMGREGRQACLESSLSWRRLLKLLGGGAGSNTSLTLEFQYQARPLRPRAILMCFEAAGDGGRSRAGQPHADSFDQGRVVGRLFLPSRDLIISFHQMSLGC